MIYRQEWPWIPLGVQSTINNILYDTSVKKWTIRVKTTQKGAGQAGKCWKQIFQYDKCKNKEKQINILLVSVIMVDTTWV